MSANSKVLQLLRNAELSPNKESAINALNGKLNELKDGQILINRYGDGSKCIIGIAYVKDDTKKMFLLESGASGESTSAALDSVKARITSLSGFEGDTYVANSNVDFINNATSLNDADKKPSEAIKNVSEDLGTEYSKAVIAQANKIKDLYESLSKRYSELLAENEELKEQLNTAKEKLTEISKICASSK